MRQLYRFLSAIEREVSPRDWAIGIALGNWLGWQVGLNLQTVIGLMLAALIRGNPLGLAIGFLTGLGAQEFSASLGLGNDIGYWILSHGASFRRVWAGLYHAPLIPFTYFYETHVMGRLVLGTINATLFFFATAAIVKTRGRQLFLKVSDGPLGFSWSHSILRHRHILHVSQYGEPPASTSLIRTKAAIFVSAVGTVSVLGIFLASPYLLQTAVSRYLTIINGAPVTIGGLHVSWLGGELELTNIAITHHAQTARNLFQIDSIKANFEVAPLLRKKAIIPKVTVSGIQLDTVKTEVVDTPYVEQIDSQVPNFLDRVAAHFFTTARKDVRANPFRSLVALQKGLDVGSYLRQEQRTLTSEKEALTISASVDALRTTCHSATDAAAVAECERSWNQLQARYKNLDEMVVNDINQLKLTLGLSNLHVEDLSTPLLGPRVLQWLERLGYWMDFSRRRMGVSLDPRMYTMVVEDNARGKSFHFGKRSTLPSLLISEIHVTSRHKPHSYYGNIEGKLTGVTNAPAVYGKSCQGTFDFEFPDNGFQRTHLSILIDHTGESNQEQFTVDAAEIPLKTWAFFQASDLFLGLKSAKASLKIDFESNESFLQVKGAMRVHSLTYDIRSPYKQLQAQLENVFQPHTEIPISFGMEGLPEEGNLKVVSPFGAKIAAALRDEFRQTQAAVDDTLRREIDDNLAIHRRSIQTRMGTTFAGFLESSRKTASLK